MEKPLPSPEQVFRHMPCLCGVLMVAARCVTRLYNDELRTVGLEVTQHSMLAVLKIVGPMTLGDLGERLAVDKTTISRNAKVLARNGWLTLNRGEDGRERIASLTEPGLRKLASARSHWDRAQERMRTALPGGQFDVLRRELPSLAVAALTA
jgi:DNA-binding MarR family transcriptional regulator